MALAAGISFSALICGIAAAIVRIISSVELEALRGEQLSLAFLFDPLQCLALCSVLRASTNSFRAIEAHCSGQLRSDCGPQIGVQDEFLWGHWPICP